MRAILIDPTPGAEDVTEVEVEGSLHSFYEIMNCDIVQFVHPDIMPDVLIICDENGKIHVDTAQRGDFFFALFPFELLCGKVLLCGRTCEGEPTDTPFVVSKVRALVTFNPKNVVRNY